VVVRRGEIWWADLGKPIASRPGKQRPVLVVSSDRFNESRIATVLAAIITSNLGLGRMPGNVLITRAASGLPKESVVNVSALATVNKSELWKRVGSLPSDLMSEVDAGLRLLFAI
jgi:mRNA interferase MazF